MAPLAPPPRRSLAGSLALAAVLIAAFAPALLDGDLYMADEVRYVEVARELDAHGDWLVPHLNGVVYREKPPMMFWAIAVGMRLGLPPVAAGRCVATLATAATALASVWLGWRLLGDARAGWIGGALVATTAIVLDRGARPLIDTLVLGTSTVGVAALVAAATATTRVGAAAATAGAALALVAGCMAKGPPALLSPVLGAIAVGASWRGRAGVRAGAVVIACAAGAAVTLIWLGFAAREAGWAYAERMLFTQTAGRAVASFAHREPWWYYMAGVPPYTLPWLVLVPGALLLARADPDPRRRGAIRGLLGWALAGIGAFSLVSGKRSGYVLPFFPPMALLAAYGALRWQEEAAAPTSTRTPTRATPTSRGLRWYRAGARALASTAVAAGGAALLFAVVRPGAELLAEATLSGRALDRALGFLAALPSWAAPVLATGGTATIVLGLGAARAVREGRALHALTLLALGVAVAAGVARLSVMPATLASRSTRGFALAVAEAWDRRAPLVLLDDDFDGRLHLFLRADRLEVVAADGLGERAAAPDRLWLVARRDRWTALSPEATSRWDLVERGAMGGRAFVLLHEQGAARP